MDAGNCICSLGNSYICYADTVLLDFDAKKFSSEELAIIERINQKVAGGETLEDIMNFLFDELPAPCDRLGLAFIEDSGSRVRAHWGRVRVGKLLLNRGFWQDLRGSTLQEIIDTGKVRIINDLAKYLEEHPDSVSTKLILKEGFKSSMTCPLKVEGRAVGFLFRSSVEKGAFSLKDVLLHAKIAERISQAVEKAYRIEQLAEANRAYSELLAFVSHEIKSPVSSIIMDTDLLLGGYLGDLNEKQKDKIQRIAIKAKFLLETAKDYLNLARIEGGEIRIEKQGKVDLWEITENALSLLDSQIQAKGMKVNCEIRKGEFLINCDADLIQIVLFNLIGNAVKYGYEGGDVKISAERRDKEVKVRVWNSGPGFAKEDKSMLFKKFSRLKSDDLIKQKGTGVGLYTVWKIINAHGGKVDADSEKGKWAEFSFTIPTA